MIWIAFALAAANKLLGAIVRWRGLQYLNVQMEGGGEIGEIPRRFLWAGRFVYTVGIAAQVALIVAILEWLFG